MPRWCIRTLALAIATTAGLLAGGRLESAVAQTPPDSAGLPAATSTKANRTGNLTDACGTALGRAGELTAAVKARDALVADADAAAAARMPTLDLIARGGSDTNRRESAASRDASSKLRSFGRAEAAISLRWVLWDFGAREARIEAAEATAQSGDEAAATAVRTVLFSCIASYVEVLRQRELYYAAQYSDQRHRELRDLVADAVRSRVEATSAAAAADALVAQRRAALAQTIVRLREVEADFNALVGSFAGDLLEPDVRDQIFRPVETLVATALERSTEVKAARLALEAARRTAAAADADRWGTLTAELDGTAGRNVEGIERQQATATALITFRMPLYDGGARRARSASASARIGEAQGRVTAAEQTIERQVRRSYAVWRMTDEQERAARLEFEATQAALTLYQAELQTDRRRLIDIMNAVNAVAEARSRLASARYVRMLAVYGLLRDTGDLPDALGLEEEAKRLTQRVAREPELSAVWRHVAGIMGRAIPAVGD